MPPRPCGRQHGRPGCVDRQLSTAPKSACFAGRHNAAVTEPDVRNHRGTASEALQMRAAARDPPLASRTHDQGPRRGRKVQLSTAAAYCVRDSACETETGLATKTQASCGPAFESNVAKPKASRWRPMAWIDSARGLSLQTACNVHGGFAFDHCRGHGYERLPSLRDDTACGRGTGLKRADKYSQSHDSISGRVGGTGLQPRFRCWGRASGYPANISCTTDLSPPLPK